MFRVLSPGSMIDSTPNRIVSFIQSLNTSPVAFNGPPVQSRATVIGVYNPQGTYTIYIAIQPIAGGQGVLFCGDPRDIPLANYRKAEAAAMEMVESQGFIMERVDIQTMSPEDALHYLQTIPIATATTSAVQQRPMSGVYEALPELRSSMGSDPGLGGGLGSGGPMYSDPYSNSQLGRDFRIPGTPVAPGASGGGGAAPRRHGRFGSGPPATFKTSPGMPVSRSHNELGVPAEEAIAVLGRLLAVF